LAVVKDGYILSGIKIKSNKPEEGFPKRVRRLYEVNDAVKVWIDWVMNRRPHANYRTGLSHLQSTHNWSRGTLVLGMGSRLWLAPRLLGERAAKPVLKSL